MDEQGAVQGGEGCRGGAGVPLERSLGDGYRRQITSRGAGVLLCDSGDTAHVEKVLEFCQRRVERLFIASIQKNRICAC